MNDRERWHWAKQRREVSNAEAMLLMRGRKVPAATGRRLVTVTSYRRRRIMDHANLVGGCKGLFDGMVRARLLIDDSDRFVTATYRQGVLSEIPPEIAREFGRRPLTVIELSDVSPVE